MAFSACRKVIEFSKYITIVQEVNLSGNFLNKNLILNLVDEEKNEGKMGS